MSTLASKFIEQHKDSFFGPEHPLVVEILQECATETQHNFFVFSDKSVLRISNPAPLVEAFEES